MKCNKILALVIVMLIVTGLLLSGCGNKANTDEPVNNDTSNNTEKTPATPADETSETKETINGVLPAAEPITYTFMINQNPNFNMVQDGEIMEYFREKTNVRLEYQSVPNEQFAEKYNTVLASNNLPDIVGGPNHAEIYGPKGLFLNIMDYEKYAPNFMKVVNDPQYSLYLRANDGGVYHMSKVVADASDRIENMIEYRSDILAELGMDEPETFDDWYEVFKAVKAKYPDMVPYCVPKDNWRFKVSSWGFWVSENMLYDENKGEWFYSPVTDNNKDAIDFHRKLYDEGLLDKEFLSMTRNDMAEKLMSGKLFAGISHSGYALPAQDTAKIRESGDTKTAFGAAPLPSSKYAPRTLPSTLPIFAYNTDKCVSFSTKIKDPEVAVAFFDYISFSPEGSLVLQLGIEGKHWTMESYGPDRTEEQTKAYLEGKANVTDMGGSDRIPVYQGIYTLYPDAMKNFKAITNNDPVQKEIAANQTKAIPFIDNRKNPPVTLFMTDDEIERTTELLSILNTIYNESRINFITGKTPMTEWDKYVTLLKNNNYEELVKIYNDAQARLDAANK